MLARVALLCLASQKAAGVDLGCDNLCHLRGVFLSCRLHIHWSKVHEFQNDPATCHAAHAHVLSACSPHCSGCAIGSLGAGCADEATTTVTNTTTTITATATVTTTTKSATTTKTTTSVTTKTTTATTTVTTSTNTKTTTTKTTTATFTRTATTDTTTATTTTNTTATLTTTNNFTNSSAMNSTHGSNASADSTNASHGKKHSRHPTVAIKNSSSTDNSSVEVGNVSVDAANVTTLKHHMSFIARGTSENLTVNVTATTDSSESGKRMTGIHSSSGNSSASNTSNKSNSSKSSKKMTGIHNSSGNSSASNTSKKSNSSKPSKEMAGISKNSANNISSNTSNQSNSSKSRNKIAGINRTSGNNSASNTSNKSSIKTAKTTTTKTTTGTLQETFCCSAALDDDNFCATCWADAPMINDKYCRESQKNCEDCGNVWCNRTDSKGSCKKFGCVEFQALNDCQCNAECVDYGSCCDDYVDICAPSAPVREMMDGADVEVAAVSDTGSASCAQLGCTNEYRPTFQCQCNDACDVHGSCCQDYWDQCVAVQKDVETKHEVGPRLFTSRAGVIALVIPSLTLAALFGWFAARRGSLKYSSRSVVLPSNGDSCAEAEADARVALVQSACSEPAPTSQ